MKKLFKELFVTIMVKFLPLAILKKIISLLIQRKSEDLEPKDSLKFLLELDNFIYELSGHHSKRYGKGIHTKHVHTNYHTFFLDRIEPGSSVLDIGCGYGSLAATLSKIDQVTITGFDISEKNIEKAKMKYPFPNILFLIGDVYKDLKKNRHYDIVVLSNVLEHLTDRSMLLSNIQKSATPKKFLIRVPSFCRDWRVPLKKEIGVEWRLDPTHHIEYTHAEIEQEISSAGLRINYICSNWGEYWLECSKAQE